MFPLWLKVCGIGLLLLGFSYYTRPVSSPLPPTVGEIWPAPRFQSIEKDYFLLKNGNFDVVISNNTCSLVDLAINRTKDVLRRWRIKHNPDETYIFPNPAIERLTIVLTSPCEEYPYLGMNEEYELEVSSNSTLASKSVWGIIRGLESFSQMFYASGQEVRIHKAIVRDKPRYAHRGLMLDTARHYISVSNILTTLDAMAMNKMNVFHWYLTDDESFPFVSQKYPKLSELGAFDNSSVYTRENITKVVEYARQRGIRVVPEINVPGHTKSWGFSYPNVISRCSMENEPKKFGPLNPLKNETYEILGGLYEELIELFPDKYLHFGGFEPDIFCWESYATTRNLMLRQNFSEYDLFAKFIKTAIELLKSKNKTDLIVWQDVISYFKVSGDTIIQIRKDFHHCMIEMNVALRSGYKIIYSATWQLDDPRYSAGDMYNTDPIQLLYTYPIQMERKHADNIIGGEALMWGTSADNTNVISKTWTKASIVAEVLWSKTTPVAKPQCTASEQTIPLPNKVIRRLTEHTNRMKHRGINAVFPNQQPKAPSAQKSPFHSGDFEDWKEMIGMELS